MGRIRSFTSETYNNVVNKVKDVVTLKTFSENFFKDDGTIQHWFSHGTTEAANMVLHGQPAPVYAGHASPPDVGDAFGKGPEDPQAMQTAMLEVPEQEMGILDQTMQKFEQQPEIVEPEMELEY